MHPSFDDITREDALDAEISASGITRQMEKDILEELGIGSDDEDESGEEDDSEEGEGDAAATEGSESANGGDPEEEQDLDKLRSEFEAAVNITPFGGKGNAVVSSDEDEDGVPHFHNREFKPFRDGRCDDTRSMMSSCSTIIDPEDVKNRVRASLARRDRAQEKRRISKKGVAGVVNRKRRENKEDIKTSTSAFWSVE